MEEIVVRQAVPSDLPYLYEICLKTGDRGKDASAQFSDPYLIGHYYIAPYPLYHKGICFVAEYERRPRGYIAAVPDTAAFMQWMEEYWLVPLRKRFPKPFPESCSEKEKNIFSLIHKQHYPVDINILPRLADYPAHLHIDLLPDIQRKGIGRTLMKSLFTELLRQGVSGLHLGVGPENRGAIDFYKKTGFSVLEEQKREITMGKRLKN